MPTRITIPAAAGKNPDRIRFQAKMAAMEIIKFQTVNEDGDIVFVLGKNRLPNTLERVEYVLNLPPGLVSMEEI